MLQDQSANVIVLSQLLLLLLQHYPVRTSRTILHRVAIASTLHANPDGKPSPLFAFFDLLVASVIAYYT